MWINTKAGLINLNRVEALLREDGGVVAVISGQRVEIANEAGRELIGKLFHLMSREDAWRINKVVDLAPLLKEARAEFEEQEARIADSKRRHNLVSAVPEIPLADCPLTTRTKTPLLRAKAKTLRQAATFTDDELLGLRNFGQRSLDELKSFIAPYVNATP